MKLLPLLQLRKFNVISDEAQDIVATFELVTPVATHRQVLDDLDDAWLEQTRAALGQGAFGRSADQPLHLVAKRVAEMLYQHNTTQPSFVQVECITTNKSTYRSQNSSKASLVRIRTSTSKIQQGLPRLKLHL